MISTTNIYSMDAETQMYFFQARMKRLLLDPKKKFSHFTDEQMELLEDSILPNMQSILKIAEEAPAGHA